MRKALFVIDEYISRLICLGKLTNVRKCSSSGNLPIGRPTRHCFLAKSVKIVPSTNSLLSANSCSQTGESNSSFFCFNGVPSMCAAVPSNEWSALRLPILRHEKHNTLDCAANTDHNNNVLESYASAALRRFFGGAAEHNTHTHTQSAPQATNRRQINIQRTTTLWGGGGDARTIRICVHQRTHNHFRPLNRIVVVRQQSRRKPRPIEHRFGGQLGTLRCGFRAATMT